MAKMGCAKCGGTKKMALGGSAVKKAPVQLYGIPQENMGTSSQMGFGRKGGSVRKMEVGGTSKINPKGIYKSGPNPKGINPKGINPGGINKSKVVTPKVITPKVTVKKTTVNLPAKTVKPGLPAKTVKAASPVKFVKAGSPAKVAAKVPVKTVAKVPAKILTIAQIKAAEVAKKASTGSKAVSTGLKVASNLPAKLAKINLADVAKKGGKNWKKLAGYAALGAGAYALDSYKNSISSKAPVKAPVKKSTAAPAKVGTNKGALASLVKTATAESKKMTNTTNKQSYKNSNVVGSHVNFTPAKTTTSTSTAPTTSTTSTTSTTPATTVKKAAVKKVVKKAATPVATVDKMAVKKPSTIETRKPADLKLIESKAKETAVENTTEKAKPAKTKSAISTGPSESFANKIRGAINDSRLRRAERAIEKGDKERSDALLNKIKESESKMKKGGSTKSKKK